MFGCLSFATLRLIRWFRCAMPGLSIRKFPFIYFQNGLVASVIFLCHFRLSYITAKKKMSEWITSSLHPCSVCRRLDSSHLRLLLFTPIMSSFLPGIEADRDAPA